VGVVVRFDRLAGGVAVQLLQGVLVVVLRLLARIVDVRMRVLVRVRMLVGVRMDHVPVRMFMGVNVGMDVDVRVAVLGLTWHDGFLQGDGKNGFHSHLLNCTPSDKGDDPIPWQGPGLHGKSHETSGYTSPKRGRGTETG
jgi:hypothetical protein